MAVGKAPATDPGIVIAAEACRAALDSTVARFTETIASLSMTTIKRRLKGATVDFPDVEIECREDEKSKDATESL